MKDKLLFMGTSNDTAYAINYAKSLGIYTVITDFNSLEKSPVKKLADESWFINVSDLDALERKGREEGITAVYAGNNEFCLDYALLLAKRLNLRYYATEEGWRVARNKVLFKEKCQQAGLSVPKTYDLSELLNGYVPGRKEGELTLKPDSEVSYPVIVKPVDMCAQQGIRVCYNSDELVAAVNFARKLSASGRIIVEDYIDGIEVAASFWATEGEIYLKSFSQFSALSVAGIKKFNLIQQDSPYFSEFRMEELPKMKAFLKSINWQNGPVFIQGIRKDGVYYWFEMGARLSGLGIWHVEKEQYGACLLESLMDYNLGKVRNQDFSTCLNLCKRKSAVYLLWIRPGKVARIEGMKELTEMAGVDVTVSRYKEGDVIEAKANMLQIAFYTTILAEDKKDLKAKLEMINQTVRFIDEDGNSMLIYKEDFSEVYDENPDSSKIKKDESGRPC